jgi:hypothetical protein
MERNQRGCCKLGIRKSEPCAREDTLSEPHHELRVDPHNHILQRDQEENDQKKYKRP